ncbi:MAG: helix-turn-helix transcriptional regulator [Treponema sp.]|nr:helix-turn-helix transcriptional regulator [Treponema sp.]
MTPSQNHDEESAAKKVPYHFGEKLREVREHRGYTLKVVAQRAGVSESLVSQIERNHVSPAIDTLLALADVLDINLEYLFEEYRKKRPVHIIRSQARASVTEHDVIYEELARPDANSADSTTECYIIKIPAGAHTHHGSFGHIGREIGLIVSGRAKFTYAGTEYILEAGDSVSFSSGSPHQLENDGDCTMEAVWFVTPAERFAK